MIYHITLNVQNVHTYIHAVVFHSVVNGFLW